MKEQVSYTNNRTKFTRMCIGEAIISLMDETPYEKLTVSAVVKKAGVARMTFYNYYDGLYAALTDYLQIIISEYLEKKRSKPEIGRFWDYTHIEFSLTFFDQYRDYFLALSRQNLHTILLNGINDFMQNFLSPQAPENIYGLYCFSGGFLNAFLKWEEGGKKEDVSVIANILYYIYKQATASEKCSEPAL